MNDAQMLEILAQVMSETERPHTAEVIRMGGEVSNIRQGTCLIAMRRVRDWAVKECAERVEWIKDSINAVAE